MLIKILHESDINLALFGLGFSHGVTSGLSFEDFLAFPELQQKMLDIARRLSCLGGGHNKFLESMQVWIDITTSRMVHQDLDTYRVGITKQSESSNHTINKRSLTQLDFEYPIPEEIMALLHARQRENDFMGVKSILPESFLQRRIISTNYKTLQNIIFQRKNHKLPQFRELCGYLLQNLKHAYLFGLGD